MEKKTEIDIKQLLFELLYRAWIIILAAAIGGTVYFVYAKKTVTPKYTTGASLYLNNYSKPEKYEVQRVGSADLFTAQELVGTYLVLLKSDRVLEVAASQLSSQGYFYTAGHLRGMMSASSVDDTEVFRVNVTHTNPEQAALIANVIAEIAMTAIPEYIEGTSVKVVDYATVPTSWSYPVYKKYVMVGGVAGGGIAALIIILLFLFNSKINNEEDIKNLFDIPVIGKIPSFDKIEDSKRNTYAYSAESREE